MKLVRRIWVRRILIGKQRLHCQFRADSVLCIAGLNIGRVEQPCNRTSCFRLNPSGVCRSHRGEVPGRVAEVGKLPRRCACAHRIQRRQPSICDRNELASKISCRWIHTIELVEEYIRHHVVPPIASARAAGVIKVNILAGILIEPSLTCRDPVKSKLICLVHADERSAHDCRNTVNRLLCLRRQLPDITRKAEILAHGHKRQIRTGQFRIEHERIVSDGNMFPISHYIRRRLIRHKVNSRDRYLLGDTRARNCNRSEENNSSISIHQCVIRAIHRAYFPSRAVSVPVVSSNARVNSSPVSFLNNPIIECSFDVSLIFL